MSQSACIKCGNPVGSYEKYCDRCVDEFQLKQDGDWHRRGHADLDLQAELIKDRIQRKAAAAAEPTKEPAIKQTRPKLKALINPNLLEVEILKARGPHLPGGKVYVPKLGRQVRRWFKTRTEAEDYIKPVHARWRRLYNFAIVAMSKQEATA